MKNKKTVLIFTKDINIDSAQAIKDYLVKDASILPIIIGEDEFLSIATRIVKDRLFNEDGIVLKYYEKIKYKLSLKLIDRVPKQKSTFKSTDPVYSKVFNILIRFNPDLIILNDNCVLKEVIAARNKAMPDVKVAMVIPDYVLNSRLINKQIDKYFVDNMAIKTTLVNLGIPEEDVILTDLPINQKFDNEVTKEEVYQDYGLSIDKKSILLSVPLFGNDGIKEAIDVLKYYKDKFNIIVDCHKDREILTYARESGIKAINEGKESYPLFALCDVVISRPESITIAKALYKECLFVALLPNNEIERRILNYMEGKIVKIDKEMNTLKSTMEKMIEYPEGFNDYLIQSAEYIAERPKGVLFKNISLLIDMK